jgi:hypothetical protein
MISAPARNGLSPAGVRNGIKSCPAHRPSSRQGQRACGSALRSEWLHGPTRRCSPSRALAALPKILRMVRIRFDLSMPSSSAVQLNARLGHARNVSHQPKRCAARNDRTKDAQAPHLFGFIGVWRLGCVRFQTCQQLCQALCDSSLLLRRQHRKYCLLVC